MSNTKRGFVFDWELADYGSPVSSMEVFLTDEFGSAIPVLVVPDPDREPSPEELEDLSRRLYEGSIPGFDVAFAPVKTESWENTFETVRASCRIFAKTAWKLGAR